MSLHTEPRVQAGADLPLVGALLVYTDKRTAALVTGHDVECPPDGPPRVIGGYPLTRDLLEAMVRLVQGTLPLRTVLPPEVVMWDGIRLAWWAPSRRRRIWFAPRQQPQLQHLSREEVVHPPLFFVADPGRLHVYALAENARPDAGTPLFQAPYLNVYADGSVCAGGVLFPTRVDVESLPLWEKAWFDSEGTHATAERLTLFPGGHDRLWEALREAEAFPVESLVPLGLTVLDAVNRDAPAAAGPAVREEIVPAEAAA